MIYTERGVYSEDPTEILVSDVLPEGQPDPTLIAAKGIDTLLAQLWRLEEEQKDVLAVRIEGKVDKMDWAFCRLKYLCGLLGTDMDKIGVECFTSEGGRNSICPKADLKFTKNRRFEDNYKECADRFCWANPPFETDEMVKYIKLMLRMVKLHEKTVFLVVIPQYIAEDERMEGLAELREI